MLNISNAQLLPLIALAVLWIIPWKGYALWKAARLSHKWWFIAILLLNTAGILDILYIFFVANKYKIEATEVEETPSAESEGEEPMSESSEEK